MYVIDTIQDFTNETTESLLSDYSLGQFELEANHSHINLFHGLSIHGPYCNEQNEWKDNTSIYKAIAMSLDLFDMALVA